MREERVYIDYFGNLIYVLINACGCHPNECLVFYSERKVRTYGAKSNRALSKMLDNEWTRL